MSAGNGMFHQQSDDTTGTRGSWCLMYHLYRAIDLYWIVLCCAALCCAALCCAALCCAVLCCAVLCCAVLCCADLCCAALCCYIMTWHCHICIPRKDHALCCKSQDHTVQLEGQEENQDHLLNDFFGSLTRPVDIPQDPLDQIKVDATCDGHPQVF